MRHSFHFIGILEIVLCATSQLQFKISYYTEIECLYFFFQMANDIFIEKQGEAQVSMIFLFIFSYVIYQNKKDSAHKGIGGNEKGDKLAKNQFIRLEP